MHDGDDRGPQPAVVRWLARAEIAVVGAVLIASLSITLYAIVARNLGHSTGDWALKVPELTLVWMTFLGMGALVTERGHVAADMFLARLPLRSRRIAHTVATVLTTAILLVILIGAVQIVRTQVAVGARDEELFNMPMAVSLVGLPLGLALTVLHLLADLYALWRRPGGVAS